MKFLCDQCKAKYQIADEKVAGKTVRMKCRKCGHMIEVRAAVTETSVSVDIPHDENPAYTGQDAAPPPGRPAPPKPAAPRATGSALATSFASARPIQTRPGSSPSRPEGTGLSGAFTKSVQKEEEAALEMLELHAADEWYVAINGVPVGPVRIAELRRKAAAGAVTEDSLVWQEGLEEWRPVKAISDLAAVVREAIAGGRVSLATPPPGEARPSSPPAPPRPPPSKPSTVGAFIPKGPHAPAPPAGRLTPVPPAAASSPSALASGALAAIRPSAPPPAPSPPTSNPFAVESAAKNGAAAVASDPFAIKAPSPSPSGHDAPVPAAAPLLAAPAVPPSVAPSARRNPPWIAIGMVLGFIAFGVTAAIVLLRPPPQPVVIQMPSAQPAPAQTAAPTDFELPAPDPNVATTQDAGTRPVAMHGGGGNKPAPATTSAAAAPAPTNSAIAALLGNNSGPALGPSPGSGGGGGSQLTSDQVEAVVRSHQTGVKRTCFERIATDKTGTVQVTVAATVGGNGQVQSVNANGNDPTIAKCIEGAVRGWQFPATGATSKLEIPFKFVRQ